MQSAKINASPNFKKKATNAVFSIILFIVVYLLLILLGVSFTIACVSIGFSILTSTISVLTIIFGLGLIILGGLVLIFLIKFIFVKNTNDLSNLTEINEEQPVLYSFIQSIATKVDTDTPKKIFLSPDVNASVFYDSSFWSMFLPVKKNLIIGMGLVNIVTVNEFRAILAHEFGHFSQKTMKVGSYVYNVNRIIYNMLFENDSYTKLANSISGFSNHLSLFVIIAMKINQGIQYILRQIYTVVNKSYMALSREMEFHADEVAANVAGSKALADSLLRLDIADNSYNQVISFYNNRIKDAVKTTNLYPQQKFVMNFLAKHVELVFQNDLPSVTSDFSYRFNRSKLVITNQWASHPSTEDRVKALKELNIPPQEEDDRLAQVLFSDVEKLQEVITEKIFSTVQYEGDIKFENAEMFAIDYQNDFSKNSFYKLFNGYYDSRNPTEVALESIEFYESEKSIAQLYSNEVLEQLYKHNSLQYDINTVKDIANKQYQIKTFDYDGIKYKAEDAPSLLTQLENEFEEVKKYLENNDKEIAIYFQKLAKKSNEYECFKRKYNDFFRIDNDYEKKLQPLINVSNNSSFIYETTPFEVIATKLITLKDYEDVFKKEINLMLEESFFNQHITDEMRVAFEKYATTEQKYFLIDSYDDFELSQLFTVMNYYQELLSLTYFQTKKNLLDLMAEMEINENTKA